MTSWTINWGDGTSQTVTGDPSSVSHVYLDGPAQDTISATVTNDEGTFDSNSLGVTVTAPPATLVISGAATADEVASYTLNLSSTEADPNAISSWTINWGDGDVQTVSGNPSSVTHVYADAGSTYPISATATDPNGIYNSNTLNVGVNLVPPTVTISGAATVDEDDTYTLDLSATGEPANHPVTSWSINWGDGPDQTISGNPNTATHVYANAGPYTITATATEDEGTFPAASLNVTALAVAPTATISGDSSVNEDASYTLNLSATGEPTNHPVTSWTIDWGDNSPEETVSGNPSSVTHVYPDASLNGPYTITASASNDETTADASQLPVTVLVVPATATISGNSSVNEDDTYTLNLSATGNPSNHPITGWTIDWGDGSGTQTISGNPSSVTHVFADASLNGPYPITAIAIEDEGQFSANLLNVTVNVVAPTVTISGAFVRQ